MTTGTLRAKLCVDFRTWEARYGHDPKVQELFVSSGLSKADFQTGLSSALTEGFLHLDPESQLISAGSRLPQLPNALPVHAATAVQPLSDSTEPTTVFNVKDMYMSNDTYNIPGQAGAVGPGAQATGNVFHQAWQQHQAEFDLKQLAAQLSELRTAMKTEGSEAEHDAAVGEVAKAEAAAKAGDGSSMLQHLKAAGKWAYGIAEKIGVAIAAKAIGKALGITP